jgi:hypothetical protein
MILFRSQQLSKVSLNQIMFMKSSNNSLSLSLSVALGFVGFKHAKMFY